MQARAWTVSPFFPLFPDATRRTGLACRRLAMDSTPPSLPGLGPEEKHREAVIDLGSNTPRPMGQWVSQMGDGKRISLPPREPPAPMIKKASFGARWGPLVSTACRRAAELPDVAGHAAHKEHQPRRVGGKNNGCSSNWVF